MIRLFAQAMRMTRRDWQAGELRLLLWAVVLAVAAVTSVGFFADRLRLGLERDAAQLLGGDLVVRGDGDSSAEVRAAADRLKLETTSTVVFPSMAIKPAAEGSADAADAAPAARLVALKAVGAGYPLRGGLRVRKLAGSGDEALETTPSHGHAWIDEQLIASLGVGVGDSLKLGDRLFTIERIITFEPDRGAGFINFSPRVLVRLDDLDSTGLLQPGSRATYRLIVAGPVPAVASFKGWLKPRLTRGQGIDSLTGGDDGGRPEMTQALDRAKSFLSLVALLTAMLAAVAIALAARRYSQRHTDSCAVMRCLGATQPEITRLFLVEFTTLAIVASVLGCIVGFGAHYVLLAVIGPLIKTELPAPSMLPALQGFVTGLVLLIGFASPPLLQLRRVSPLRVLRRDLGLPTLSASFTYGMGVVAFLALLFWFAGDPKLGLITGFGFVGGFVAFAGITYGLLRAVGSLRGGVGKLSPAMRFAFAGALRRPGSTVVQIVALAAGLMALLLLTITRTDLVDSWRGAAPADAPNRFVINIQADQRERFNQLLVENGLAAQEIQPMVRGRLVAINDKPVMLDGYEGNARRLVDREFNLSYRADLPGWNKVVDGHWNEAGDSREISVEQGLMKTLNLKLGDTLRFDIAGSLAEARICSVRKLDWNSMRVNFFVIFPPALLEPLQQSFITSFNMPDSHDFGARLVNEMPNLTVVDTGAILRQVQMVLDQVITAVEFLFVFTLAAGVLVLWAALATTRDERRRDAGLLRALGASRALLRRAQLAEFALVGSIAGLLASIGASALGYAIARFAFDLSIGFNPLVIVGGTLAGALLSLLGAWTSLRSVTRQPPLATLREA
ncbi:FtsX-like permease family protein [soil metagenome]